MSIAVIGVKQTRLSSFYLCLAEATRCPFSLRSVVSELTSYLNASHSADRQPATQMTSPTTSGIGGKASHHYMSNFSAILISSSISVPR